MTGKVKKYGDVHIYRKTTLYLAGGGTPFCGFVEEVIGRCRKNNINKYTPHYLMFNDITLPVHKDSDVIELQNEYHAALYKVKS